MDQNEKIQKIGCVGLGVMGRPAALNLIRAGFSVAVWARRPESCKPLADAGAEVFESPKALAAGCDAVVTNVSDSPDVENLVLGADGIADGIARGGLVIDMSTISPSTARKVAAGLASRGADFLDAPVSGGEKGAIEGALTFMVGGAEDAFNRGLPVMRAMGKTVTRIGESGAGQVAKACNQVIIGATIGGVAEALRLARANGADPAKVREALLGGFASSKVLETHAMRMLTGDYAPGFKAKLHLKDMNIALDNARENRIPLPSAELFRGRLRRLMDAGDGELDSAAAAKMVDLEEREELE